MEVLEIGCAPGKHLVWVAKVLGARVAGVDYSRCGMEFTRKLFNVLGVEGDLRCEDVFSTTFQAEQLDVVYRVGVVEHFDDARPEVQRHLDFVKPGGVALIAGSNYGGVYGSLQRWCDASNLALHNLEIMNLCALNALVDSPDVESARPYPFGAMSPWLVSLDKRLPLFLAKLVSLGVNTMGLLQRLAVEPLAPMRVLEVRKVPVA